MSTYRMFAICLTVILVIGGAVEAQKAKPKTRKEREKENAEAFAQLSYPQQRWVVWRALHGTQAKGGYTIGWMGRFSESYEILNVVSPTEIIAVWKPGGITIRDTVWVSGLDTSKMVDDQIFRPGDSIFWIPRTKTYPTAGGGTKTVYEVERIPDCEKTKDIVPPKEAKLEDYPPK